MSARSLLFRVKGNVYSHTCQFRAVMAMTKCYMCTCHIRYDTCTIFSFHKQHFSACGACQSLQTYPASCCTGKRRRVRDTTSLRTMHTHARHNHESNKVKMKRMQTEPPSSAAHLRRHPRLDRFPDPAACLDETRRLLQLRRVRRRDVSRCFLGFFTPHKTLVKT